jgi:hypothetical protein
LLIRKHERHVERAINQFPPEHRDRIMRGNAMALYGLPSAVKAISGALSRFSPNILLTPVQSDADLTDQPLLFASPPRQRQRITNQLQAEVIEAYGFGQTSWEVAETFAIGRTTVLKILKAAGVRVRPQGRKY